MLKSNKVEISYIERTPLPDITIVNNGSPDLPNVALETAMQIDKKSVSPSHDTAKNMNTEIDQLENEEEKIKRKRSHHVVYLTSLVMSIGYSIILTGIWPYLKKLDPSTPKELLGWVIAMTPLGQMITSPLLGYLSNRFNCLRASFVITTLVFIGGNILYALLGFFGTYARLVMLISRFIIGVSSANVALCRSYIAASTLISEKTSGQSLLAASQAIGFIIGPFLQTAISLIMSPPQSDGHLSQNNSTESEGISYKESSYEEYSFPVWNMYSATGVVAAVLSLFNLFMFLPCIFKEHNIAKKEAELNSRKESSTDISSLKIDYLTLIFTLITFFIILSIFVLIETLTVPMVMDLYAWDSTFAVKVVGISLSIAGIMAVIMFALTGVLAKRFSDRFVYIVFGLIPLTIGISIHVPMGTTLPQIMNCTNPSKGESHVMPEVPMPLYASKVAVDLYEAELLSSKKNEYFNENSVDSIIRNKRAAVHQNLDGHCTPGCPPSQEWCFYTPIVEIPQMAVADFFIVLGYSVSFAMTSAIFSKLLGPKPQGTWMGVLTSCGSFSRMVGPIFVTYVYTNKGPRWTFVIILATMFSVLVGNSLIYKRLVPLQKENEENANQNDNKP